MQQTDQVVINALFWLAILMLLMDQRHHVTCDRPQRYIGFLLLGLIVTKSLTMSHAEAWFVRLFPAFAVLILGLLTGGGQLKQHWRIGLLLMPLMLPRSAVEHMAEQTIGLPLQIVTAQVAAFGLHYVGFDAHQQHTIITLNQGAVDVLFRCTGIPLFILLSQLALLFFMLFPLSRPQQIKITIVALVIAFLLSSLRVALMAVVVKDPVAFAYWHGGNGSQIFSTDAIVLFGWWCQRSLPPVQVN